MRILFLLYFDVDGPNQIGVSKKIQYQINAMEKLGHRVTLGFCSNNKFVLRDSDNERSFEAISGRSHYRKALRGLLLKLYSDYELIYVRFPGSIDWFIYDTFKRIHKKNAKIILEMPTYPIGGELLGYLRKLKGERQYIQYIIRSTVYGMHRILSRRLYHYVDAIVSYSEYQKIWSINTINIENGIDCDNITPKSRNSENSSCINMLCVASFAEWHGIDRVIAGLQNYYAQENRPECDVELTLVGSSPYLDKLLSSIGNELSSHLNIKGSLYGRELDEEYDKANIAISSLGMHRIGLKYGSTLKTREYCAKGIPFIYGYIEKGIDNTFKYAFQVAANEDPININEIITFYESIKQDDYIEEMRKFAKKYDWKNQMNIVFNKLNEWKII